jgi:DNA-directed RNA polymerase specialized sigma24 family protein
MGIYVDNKAFADALMEYRDICISCDSRDEKHPPIPKYIADCFAEIAKNYSTKFNFARYSFRDDMVSEAYVTCCEKILKYDARKSPFAFSYFSRICFRVFIDMIWQEKTESYVKAKMYVSNVDDGFDEDVIGDSAEADPLSNDFIPYFDIADFEKKVAEKKAKVKQRAAELAAQKKGTATIESILE